VQTQQQLLFAESASDGWGPPKASSSGSCALSLSERSDDDSCTIMVRATNRIKEKKHYLHISPEYINIISIGRSVSRLVDRAPETRSVW
jgi:hypothetical protein